MTDKVLTPTVVEDSPFPGEEGIGVPTFTQTSGGNSIPTTTKDTRLPTKRIAVETISSALNTKNKKILAEFEFTEHGAIQIGKYSHGVTGDLRITPSGITARDLAGLNTFAIDGTTGSAVFKGSIQSGSLITGDVIVGNNSVIIDGGNKRIIVNDGTNDRIVIGNV